MGPSHTVQCLFTIIWNIHYWHCTNTSSYIRSATSNLGSYSCIIH